MIKTIKHKGLRLFFSSGDVSKLAPDMVDKIGTILSRLEVSDRIEDMDRPSFKLHALKGDMKGLYAVTVRSNWRIVFRFEDGDIFDVDFIDYH